MPDTGHSRWQVLTGKEDDRFPKELRKQEQENRRQKGRCQDGEGTQVPMVQTRRPDWKM